MDTDSFIVHVKIEDLQSITRDLETWFDFSSLELGRPLPKGKNKNVIGSMKDELSEKIMNEFVGILI